MTAAFTFAPLETARLLLRPLERTDIDFVFEHFSDPAVSQYLLDEEPLQTRQAAQAIIDFYLAPIDKPYNRWVIILKSDWRPIGTCGYHKWRQQHHCVEIGYDLAKEFWQQGYMTEALQAAINYGFKQMNLNRIEAQVYPANNASLRLLERLGFNREGLLRQVIYQGNNFYDHWLLALLRTEWLAQGQGMEKSAPGQPV